MKGSWPKQHYLCIACWSTPFDVCTIEYPFISIKMALRKWLADPFRCDWWSPRCDWWRTKRWLVGITSKNGWKCNTGIVTIFGWWFISNNLKNSVQIAPYQTPQIVSHFVSHSQDPEALFLWVVRSWKEKRFLPITSGPPAFPSVEASPIEAPFDMANTNVPSRLSSSPVLSD